MADPNYLDKLSDPEFQKDFESLSQADQDKVLQTMGVSRTTQTLTPMLAGKKHMQGLQPQKGEDPNLTQDWTDKALLGVNGLTTTAAAMGMAPEIAGTIPGGLPALRALLAGGATAGIDTVTGGDHPLRSGLEAAATTALLPGAGKLMGKYMPTKLKALLSLFEPAAQDHVNPFPSTRTSPTMPGPQGFGNLGLGTATQAEPTLEEILAKSAGSRFTPGQYNLPTPQAEVPVGGAHIPDYTGPTIPTPATPAPRKSLADMMGIKLSGTPPTPPTFESSPRALPSGRNVGPIPKAPIVGAERDLLTGKMLPKGVKAAEKLAEDVKGLTPAKLQDALTKAKARIDQEKARQSLVDMLKSK